MGGGMILPPAPVKAFVTARTVARSRAPSEVLGDGLELFDRRLWRPLLVLDGVRQAVIDVVVDQRLLGGRDRPFHGVELLDDVHAGTPGFHHPDDIAQMTLSALQPLDDVGVRLVNDMCHTA